MTNFQTFVRQYIYAKLYVYMYLWSEQWAVGTMGRRNNGLSEQWAVGIMGCRNNGSSELWAVGIMTRNHRPTSCEVWGFNKAKDIKRVHLKKI